MSKEYVYGSCEAVAYVDGVRVVVHIDQAWDASDPIVKKRPDLFGLDPEDARGTVAPVEAATAAPGAKRATRRSAKK